MLSFELKQKQATQKSDYLILGLSAKNGKPVMSAVAKEIDNAVGGLLSEVVRRGDFKAEKGKTLLLHGRDWLFKRLLLVGVDKDGDGWQQAFAKIDGTITVAGALNDEKVLMRLAAAIAASCYQYQQGGYCPQAGGIKRARIFVERGGKFTAGQLPALAKNANALIEGICLVRHLAEQPGNVCEPEFLASVAGDMAKKTSLRTTVLTEKEMRKLKMNALLAVSQGSRRPPRLIVLEHKGAAKKAAPVVLVGKGVTFDTGGISLKPSAAMDEMKFDMCGGASVFGTLLACARMKLPLNVIGIVPACENMPDGNALKPGDVITAMNGKSIEVLNTDAEGRLILADALCYAARYQPAAVVDIATLTGACIIALGQHNSGLMSTDDGLAAQLQNAGEASGDSCWRLPLGEEYQ